jgi:hypothetical protein
LRFLLIPGLCSSWCEFSSYPWWTPATHWASGYMVAKE